MSPSLPNVVILGAAKAGTTALHYYLGLHPEVAMSSPKELDYFVGEPVARAPGCDLTPEELAIAARAEANWGKDTAWYEGFFPADATVRGEASPNYTAPWFPEVAQRMASVIPETRLIFLTRDPVDRALTHYLTLRSAGREHRQPDEALSRLSGLYVSRSCYFTVLKPYFDLFGSSRILVMDQDALRDDRARALRSVFRFLQVDEQFWSPKFERERNPSTARPRHLGVEKALDRLRIRRAISRIPPEWKWRIERTFLSVGGNAALPQLSAPTRERVTAFLREDAERFRKLTGEQFAHWSI
jgi:hypothetical protein